MTTNPHNPLTSAPAGCSAEETLRLIASLPAPKGLEERIETALRSAPRQGRVLAWPAALRPQSAWVRATAAAALVCVVVGGGWSVYSHVRPAATAHGVVLPVNGPAAGGFSSAGAMRTPQTLNGPVLLEPAKQQTAKTSTPAAKAGALAGLSSVRNARRAASAKAALTPAR